MKTIILSCLAMSFTLAADMIPPNDPRLEYSDYDQIVKTETHVQFMRRIPIGSQYHLDSPGARLRFRCNASEISILLEYQERKNPNRAQNDIGVFLIDGQGKDEWIFKRGKPGRETDKVTVKLPADGEMHDYELVMPYGDIVRIKGVETSPETKFEKPSPRPALRCVFYGDSITQGFTASRIDRTYPYLLSRMKNYECINIGLAGIGISPAAGKTLGQLKMDQLIVAIGVNNWQGGSNPDNVRKDMDHFLAQFRELQPSTPVIVITPLYVPSSWQPKTVKYDLQQYRDVIAQAARNHNCRVINGDELTTHDPALFDKIAVHPNDAGFRQIANCLFENL